MYEWWESTQAVSGAPRYDSLHRQFLTGTVVPSNMNPVGEEGNLFSALFDKVPAKRAGNEDDMAGTILYLVSRAGVSLVSFIGTCLAFLDGSMMMLIPYVGVRIWYIALCRRRPHSAC